MTDRSSPGLATVVERAIREYCRKSPGFPDLSLSGMAQDIVDAIGVAQPRPPASEVLVEALEDIVANAMNGEWTLPSTFAARATAALSSTDGKP